MLLLEIPSPNRTEEKFTAAAAMRELGPAACGSDPESRLRHPCNHVGGAVVHMNIETAQRLRICHHHLCTCSISFCFYPTKYWSAQPSPTIQTPFFYDRFTPQKYHLSGPISRPKGAHVESPRQNIAAPGDHVWGSTK